MKAKPHTATELQKQQDRTSLKPAILGFVATLLAPVISTAASEAMHHMHSIRPETVNSTVAQPKSCEK
ncbi:hypothetical protein [Kitasatospora sp. NPDC051705]|uniref:hypothetical protein n=1 Tax=Kitasatospora sp. NPDC051705 TaxID=3364057 RepID=UPI003797E09A